MTEKCVFCNGTGKEHGFDGCAWCENTGRLDVKRDASGSMVGVALATADAINHGTGVMQVSAEGVEHVPLADVLVDLKRFRLLPYGTKFRYRGTTDAWVRIGNNLIAEWPGRVFDSAGEPRQSLCIFCHLDGDEDGNTLDTLVEVVDQDTELAALREELAKQVARTNDYCSKFTGAEQRLAAAEQRNAELVELLKGYPRGVPGFAEWAGKVDATLEPTESGAGE